MMVEEDVPHSPFPNGTFTTIVRDFADDNSPRVAYETNKLIYHQSSQSSNYDVPKPSPYLAAFSYENVLKEFNGDNQVNNCEVSKVSSPRARGVTNSLLTQSGRDKSSPPRQSMPRPRVYLYDGFLSSTTFDEFIEHPQVNSLRRLPDRRNNDPLPEPTLAAEKRSALSAIKSVLETAIKSSPISPRTALFPAAQRPVNRDRPQVSDPLVHKDTYRSMEGKLAVRTEAKAKAVEDARKMQTYVIDECKKSGKDPPPFALEELIGKGSFGRVYKGLAVYPIYHVPID